MDDDTVIVVGGGLSGLAAAATAARAGARVELLEAGSRLGGRARTVEYEGCALNLGPHALYGGGPAERVLRGLGVRPAGRTPKPFNHRMLAAGQLRAAPYTLAGLSPRLLRALAPVVSGRAERRAEGTAADWLAAQDARARPALAALLRVATYVGDPAALPAPLALRQLRLGTWPGVRYLDGGWGVLVAELAQAATAAGATLTTGKRVVALRPDGGVELADGSTRRAGATVLAGLGPAAAGRLLATAGGAVALPEAPRPVLAACLDVALRRLPRARHDFVLVRDEPLYLSVHSATARLAPKGAAVVHVAQYLADGERPDRRRLEALLELAQPGWREEVVHARFLPRMHVVEHAGTRVAATASGLPWVLLAGDWVGEKGWLADAALASGAGAGARAAAVARSGMIGVTA